MTKTEFWLTKKLTQMSTQEWESLCDGCARCCLNKLEDWDTGEIYWTNIACELLDIKACRCSDYENRQVLMPDCIQLDAGKVATITWLPPTCAYRLVHEGKDLPPWHPLKTNNTNTVHQAGVSIKGQTISEKDVEVEEFENHIVTWPGEKI